MTGIHIRRRTPLALLAGGAVSFLVAGAMAAAPALAGNGQGGPPGSNGTIKINDVALGPGHGNDPHISCPFLVTFWGFDTGSNNASVAFTAQPPSGKFTAIALKAPSDPASFTFTGHGAGNTLDASKSYSLDTSGLFRQPQQGFHVKVVVTVTSAQSSSASTGNNGQGKGKGSSAASNGNGKANGQSSTQKSKVFWTECAPAETPPTQAPSSPPASPPASPVPTPSVAPTSTATAPAVAPTVIGEAVTKPTPAKQLPFTGAPTGLLVSTALGFILTGCGLLGMTRRPSFGGRHR